NTTRAEQPGGISPVIHSVLAVRLPEQCPAGLFQRNLHPPHNMVDGVSTYLALIFGTLLSSQGTDASFVLALSGFPPGFPSCFQPYQIRFPFRFRSEFISGGQLGGLCLFDCLAAFFRRVRLYQKFLTGLTGHSFLIYREVLHRNRIPGS
ncbi:hypothetical protein, partial [Streptomyces umbrinus]|uniref:hypothetical protein n=1 Tax=Streptomyces umbrinus TaxID=67370 RepID=UPI0033C7BEEA